MCMNFGLTSIPELGFTEKSIKYLKVYILDASHIVVSKWFSFKSHPY